MCKQLERLALQPQRWGLTGEAGVSQTVCFLFDMLVFWYWSCWRQCGSTVVVGFQLEEESPLRVAYLPDHWDDGLFCMTTTDNERLDQEPTDCPRTSCIIQLATLSLLCFHTNLRPLLHQPTLSGAKLCSCLISVRLQRCRHGRVLKWLYFIISWICSEVVFYNNGTAVSL